jgi:TolA-binding protein
MESKTPRVLRPTTLLLAGGLFCSALFLTGCSQMTLLRTQEIRKVEAQVAATRKEVSDLQKAIDELNLKQGGSTNRMRADLTALMTDLKTQISSLHAEIDETQHRLTQLNQKLDKLDQRKVVVSAPAPAMGADSTIRSAPQAVRVIPGLDLDHLFNTAREDYIRGKYDLAYQGFKALYEKDDGGTYKELSLYWMGECLWKADRPDRALEMYQRVLKEFPAGSQGCPARLKMGLIYDQKSDIARRNEIWKQLVAVCPQTNEAERAQELMK